LAAVLASSSRDHAHGATELWDGRSIKIGELRARWRGSALPQFLCCLLSLPTSAPSPGIGQVLEHLTAFGLVAGMFAIGYRFTLTRLLLMALLFCGGIELLQVPLPTRHARVSDFAIDLFGSYFAIGLVAFATSRSSAARLTPRPPIVSG
jgi:hypothetical protein